MPATWPDFDKLPAAKKHKFLPIPPGQAPLAPLARAVGATGACPRQAAGAVPACLDVLRRPSGPRHRGTRPGSWVLSFLVWLFRVWRVNANIWASFRESPARLMPPQSERIFFPSGPIERGLPHTVFSQATTPTIMRTLPGWRTEGPRNCSTPINIQNYSFCSNTSTETESMVRWRNFHQ